MSAVCGTTDPTASDYKVEIRLQDQRVEIITRMDEMVRALLNAWKDKNGSLPRKIVCFRDGISDGEFHQVVQTEIASIRRASELDSLSLALLLALTQPLVLPSCRGLPGAEP